MGEPFIHFLVSSELKRHFQTEDGLAAAMVLFPSRAGEIAHIIQTYRQTYQLLSALGLQSELVDSMPSEGIVVCHRRSFPSDYKPSEKVFLVYCKGDWDVNRYGNVHVIQNPNDMRGLDPVFWPTHYIPHYPQPGLQPRSEERDDAFVNIAYVGDLDNLAPELKAEKFREDLRARGLQWHLYEHSRWHDYSNLDAIVAVRSFKGDAPFIEKPATKLFNAWHAQVPAILGAECGYRAHRTSEWDYIEVSTYEGLLSALERLRDDTGLCRRMRDNSRTRAPEVTADEIARRWKEFLVSVAIPAYTEWRQMGAIGGPATSGRPRFKRASGSAKQPPFGVASANEWIKTHPDSPVRNSQSAGIGRIEAFGDTILINNLGRNIEISRFENSGLHRQRLHHETIYPVDDELSQFDLDMHAFLGSTDRRHLLALNHHGLVCVFEMPSFRTVCSLQWYGDIERTVMIDDCLVGSSPGGYATDDPAKDGIVIGEPWGDSRERIRCSFALADWGKVSAVEAAGLRGGLAVAAGRRLGLFSLRRSGRVRIDRLLWKVDLSFSVRWIKYAPMERKFFVAGDEFVAVSEESGKLLQQFPLAPDIAWGNGAVPLGLAGDQLIGADRLGGIYSWDNSSASARIIREPDATQSLGFAHMAICGNHILCGYNRGGYRILHANIRTN